MVLIGTLCARSLHHSAGDHMSCHFPEAYGAEEPHPPNLWPQLVRSHQSKPSSGVLQLQALCHGPGGLSRQRSGHMVVPVISEQASLFGAAQP